MCADTPQRTCPVLRGLQWAVASGGLSLEAIAARAHISPSCLRTLLAGCVNPRLAVLVDVAATLGCTETYAHGEAAVDWGLTLTLCYADPRHRAEVISKAALGVSLKRRSQHTEVLFLSLVQPADWVIASLARLSRPFLPRFATAADLPGLGSPEGYYALVALIDEYRPDVLVLDNLGRLHRKAGEATLERFREADRSALRQLRQVLEGLHRLEVLTVHFVDRDDAKQLEEDGLVDRVVSIDEELLTHRRSQARQPSWEASHETGKSES